MKIKLELQSVYGNELAYPACETSKLLARLSGHKTLTVAAVGLIRSLGYEIEWAQPASKFSKLTNKDMS